MIFVTVGTNEAAFDRLVVSLDRIEGDEEIVAQCGSSAHRPGRAECVDFLPFEELADLMRRARVVVTHAGAGSTMVALANGKRPIVVPRLRRFGEVADDHQLPFARRLAERGLVRLVEDPDRLPEALAGEVDGTYAGAFGADERLVRELKLVIDTVLSPARNGRSPQ